MIYRSGMSWWWRRDARREGPQVAGQEFGGGRRLDVAVVVDQSLGELDVGLGLAHHRGVGEGQDGLEVLHAEVEVVREVRRRTGDLT
ncbi:hypothetical protein [Nonomuraea sp. NPDC005650]|uniref:hypothetical protein n=1 Tax=Nonomuraea sp. NPDC005650 TaxID=3157045 RepID=UPI0033B892A0